MQFPVNAITGLIVFALTHVDVRTYRDLRQNRYVKSTKSRDGPKSLIPNGKFLVAVLQVITAQKRMMILESNFLQREKLLQWRFYLRTPVLLAPKSLYFQISMAKSSVFKFLAGYPVRNFNKTESLATEMGSIGVPPSTPDKNL